MNKTAAKRNFKSYIPGRSLRGQKQVFKDRFKAALSSEILVGQRGRWFFATDKCVLKSAIYLAGAIWVSESRFSTTRENKPEECLRSGCLHGTVRLRVACSKLISKPLLSS